MKFIPIAARSARWLSFALAITLALQFVSPLVLAAEPQYTPIFAAMDSRPADRVEDELLEEDELPEEDEFASFKGNLDSMPVLDSFPQRAPVLDSVDWSSNVILTVKLNDNITLYDPQNPPDPNAPPYIELGANTNKLNIAVDFSMPNPSSDPRPDITKEYIIKLSDKLVDFDFTPSAFPPDLPVLHCKPAPNHPAIIITMDPEAANRSDLKAKFNLQFALKPYAGGDPADPEKIPIIDTDLTGPVYIYPVGAVGDPEIDKGNGDVSGIATAPHPVNWTVKFRTGRKAPINTPNYEERSVVLTDTVKSAEQTFEEGTIDLKLINNSGSSPVSTSLAKANDPTNLTNKPCYSISADKQILTVYLEDMTDNKDPETLHQLTYTTNVNADYFSKNQDKAISNAASLTVEGKPAVKDNGSAKLPKWIIKGNGEKGIDRDRVPSAEMPVAWEIRVNPNKTAGITVPSGAILTDKLPTGLKKVVSVRSATKKADGSYESVSDMYVPGPANVDNAWSLMDGTNDNTSSGTLNPSSDPSGTLTYTYPAALSLDGKEQVFIVTALVDLQGVGSDQTVAQTFTNEAFLQLGTTAPGFSSGKSTVDVGVGYTLLHKEGKLDNLRDRTITWTTKVNNLNQTISNPVAIDKLGKGQLYVPGSFKVLDSNGAYTAGTFQLYKKDKTLVSDNTQSNAGIVAGDEFYWEYDFEAAMITGPYTITYQTYALHGDYPTGTANDKRTNTVTLYEKKNDGQLHEVVTDNTYVDVNTTLMSKVMQSYNPTPDPDDTAPNKRRRITWKVTLNKDGAFIKDPKFSDALQKGLVYKPGTFKVQAPGDPNFVTEPAGFAYIADTLSYDFRPLKKPADFTNPTVYYPDDNATGIAGQYIITFETYVPETMWDTDKSGTSDLSNTAKLTFDGDKTASAKADVTIKNPTIDKTYTTGKDTIGKYFEWTILLNRNGSKLDETTIIDHLPTGVVIAYSHPDVVLPKLTAHKIIQSGNNNTQQPTYEPVGTEIPLVLGKNAFYEACTDGTNGTVNVHDLRIELKNLLQSYPEGCVFKLVVRTHPTAELSNAQNKVTMKGFGENTFEGTSKGFQVTKSEADGNGSSLVGHLNVMKKVVETNGDETPAGSIEFSLLEPHGRVVGVLPTGSDGTCQFTKLRTGDYELKETSSLNGYWCTGGKTVHISSSTPVQSADVKNYANQIFVVKKDADVNQPLAGAKFQLYTKAGVKVEAVKTTDANGMCSWEKLAEGQYYIEEVAAPTGYTLSGVKKSAIFKISRTELPKDTNLSDADDTTANGKYVDHSLDAAWDKTPAFVFEFSNPRTGGVSVEKHDAVTNLPLEGAQFGLYQNGVTLPLESKLTNALGKLTFDTPLKDKTTYEVREQLAPEEYLLNGYTSGAFTTDFANQSAEQRFYSYSATNMKNLVVCEKVSSIDAAKKLPDAVFGLYKADGTLISTATSDADGRFSFVGVPAGAYIQEITPPAGYQLDTQTRYTPALTAASTENPPLYTFKNKPVQTGGGGDGGGGGGGSPLLPPKNPSSSSSSSSSSMASGSSINPEDESSSSRPWPPEDENGNISPEGMTPDEVGRLLDEGYRPTRDVPFGLTREQVIKMILDENIPLGRLPATGDASGRIVFPLVLMAVASAAISGLCMTRRRKRKQA